MANKVIAVELANASRKMHASHKVIAAVDGGEVELGFSAKVVQALPATGEKQYLYLVPKEGSSQDEYDEWLWAVHDDGTYGWEHVGSTEVHVVLYNETGNNEDGAMTQKATTSALGGKVDKAEGKGLSSNDFTDNDASKLSGIEAGAQVNAPLYTTTGNNEDGAMTQKAVTDILGDIESTLHAINNGEES